ncbi:MAG TPA: hypothetical protein VKA15_19675 [Isosphaeraceae bacterium]|nr:hypothetical protein [Isosphaeraceae bacterium]
MRVPLDELVEKPAAKGVQHPETATNDSLRKPIARVDIPLRPCPLFICVYLCSSVAGIVFVLLGAGVDAVPPFARPSFEDLDSLRRSIVTGPAPWGDSGLDPTGTLETTRSPR